MIERCSKCGRIKQRRHNCKQEMQTEIHQASTARVWDKMPDEDGFSVSMNTCISHPERNLYSAQCPSCAGAGCPKCGGNGYFEWCPQCREVAENPMRPVKRDSAGYAALNGGKKL